MSCAHVALVMSGGQNLSNHSHWTKEPQKMGNVLSTLRMNPEPWIPGSMDPYATEVNKVSLSTPPMSSPIRSRTIERRGNLLKHTSSMVDAKLASLELAP